MAVALVPALRLHLSVRPALRFPPGVARRTGSWLLVIVAEVALALLAPPHLVVAALALGFTIGQTVVAIPLVMVTRRMRGKAAVQGVGHAALAGLAAGGAGATVGVAVSIALPVNNKLLAGGVAVLAAGGAVIAFGVVAYLLDDGELQPILARVRQAARLRS